MLINYFKIAWRNISRHKIYTFINVTGLAFGISACLVIYLITSYDLSFDRFHPDGDRIYRIVGEMQRGDGEKNFANSIFSDVAGFQDQIPGFEAAIGFHTFGVNSTIPVAGKPAKKFSGQFDNGIAGILTGSAYFDVFTYRWLAGNAATLQEPFKVVLTERRARQYFGDLPPAQFIGRTVIYADSLPVTVSGIVKDWDQHTDLGFTDFVSISTATHSWLKTHIPTEDWTSLSPHRSQAFVKLGKGVTAAQVDARFAAYVKQHVRLSTDTRLRMWLQPLTDLHFTPDFHRGDDGDNQFRKAYLPTIYALIGVALFILVIAAINFINLSTAQSLRRAKETGIRKVMGSGRGGLIAQFLSETFVLTLLAVGISILLVNPLLRFFQAYVPDGVSFSLNAPTLVFLGTITLFTSWQASTLLSCYRPIPRYKA